MNNNKHIKEKKILFTKTCTNYYAKKDLTLP